MFPHSSAPPSRPSNAITGASLTTLALGPSSSPTACPYTSPQNGKAECIICSTNNVMRSLLFQASLPAPYWVESIHTATFLLNRLPTKTISASCPYFALFGTTPTYEHLHVFGCACYPNMSATAPHKLAPHSARCLPQVF
jgi:hypothetical protein